MEERMAADRAKAEAQMREKYGPDYVMPEPSKVIREYEDEKMKREEATKNMQFSQREMLESFAAFAMSDQYKGKIDPEAMGNFMRFIEAKKIAAKEMAEHPELEGVTVQGAAPTDAHAAVADSSSVAPATFAPSTSASAK